MTRYRKENENEFRIIDFEIDWYNTLMWFAY